MVVAWQETAEGWSRGMSVGFMLVTGLQQRKRGPGTRRKGAFARSIASRGISVQVIQLRESQQPIHEYNVCLPRLHVLLMRAEVQAAKWRSAAAAPRAPGRLCGRRRCTCGSQQRQ